MVAPYNVASQNSQPGMGLQYRPMSAGRQFAAGGLTGLGGLLLALATGKDPSTAIQSGLQGFDEQQWRRQEQDRQNQYWQWQQEDRADTKAEKATKREKAAADAARWGQGLSLLTDADPTNDPKSPKDFLPYLPQEMQMQMVPELFKGKEPYSAYAKMQADVDAGLVPQSALDQWWRHETAPPQGPVTWSDIRDDKGNIVGQRSSTGQVNYFNSYPGQPQGAFPGTGVDSASLNILLDPKADPNSPAYAAAYAQLAMPKVNFDPVTQKTVIVQPDMSWARKPNVGGGGAPAPAAGPTGPTPQVGPTVENAQQQPQLPSQTMQVPGATITSSPGVPTFNETQGKAATFADRIAAANSTLEATFAAGSDPVQKGLSMIPLAGNYLTSGATQQFQQAERDFINAVLRRESGAVISPTEFTDARQQYIPQPGDSKAVLDQKKAARDRALKGMARDAGPAYQPPSGDGSVPPPPKGFQVIQ